MTSHAALASHVAAASSTSTNDITPGVLGFLVVAAMAVALFFLLRSMNKRLRRVRAVRDAGLAPGSELRGAEGASRSSAGAGHPHVDRAGSKSANGAAPASAPANASRGRAAGGAAATGANSENSAESDVAAGPGDPAGGGAGG